jgi:Fe-S oxidoreductase/nitrate reductase gamma subunit
MEIKREIFWNIPNLLKFLFYLFSFISFLIFLYGIYLHFKFWNEGRGNFKIDFKKGFKNLIKYGILQIKVLDEKFSGIMHLFIYSGFLILFLGTFILTIQERITEPFFKIHFLKNFPFLLFEFIMDFAALLLIIGVIIAIVRRYFIKPKRITYEFDFYLILWLLFFIGITGVITESFRIIGEKTPLPFFSFLGFLFSLFFKNLDLYLIKKLHLILWIIHAFLSLFLISYIPYSSFSHIIFSLLNLFFQETEKNYIEKIDFEKEEFFGVNSLKDFKKKEIVGIDACIKCGRCEDFCPANEAKTPLSPKRVILNLKKLYKDKGIFIIDNLIKVDEIMSCTTCLNCFYKCPIFVPIVDIIIDLRRYLSLSLGKLPKTLSDILRNIERYGNPYGETSERFLKFKDFLNFADENKEYDFILWIGCVSAFEPRAQRVVKSFINLLNKLKLNYCVIKEEKCTGDIARRIGNEYLFQNLAFENINNLKKYKFKRILTLCPHCYHVFKNEYKEFGFDKEVIHHTQFLEELILSGKIKLKKSDFDFVYHDPCYLGRYNKIFDSPRKIIKYMGNLKETERNRENSFCCGGGGGNMWFEAISERKINEIRFYQLLKISKNIVTSCPYCLLMFDAVLKLKEDEKINLKDICEYVEEFSI